MTTRSDSAAVGTILAVTRGKSRGFRPHCADNHTGVYQMGSGTKPVINSWEATYLIRQGLSDLALMKRYSISAKGLESLFSKLVNAGDITQEELEQRSLRFLMTNAVDVSSAPVVQSSEKITISAAEAVDCIRSGMTDRAIMEKYNLSTRGLASLFKKLAAGGEIDQDELDARKNVLEWAEIAFVHIPDDESTFYELPKLPERLSASDEDPQAQAKDRLETSEGPVLPFDRPAVGSGGLRKFFGKHKAMIAGGGGLLAGMFLLAAAFSFIAGVDYAMDVTLSWWRKPPPTPKIEDSLHDQADRTAKALQSIAVEAPGFREPRGHAASGTQSYEECLRSCEGDVDMGDHLDRVILMYCRRECALRRSATARGIRKRYHEPAIQF